MSWVEDFEDVGSMRSALKALAESPASASPILYTLLHVIYNL